MNKTLTFLLLGLTVLVGPLAAASLSDAQALRQIDILLTQPETAAGRKAGLKVLRFAAASPNYHVDLSLAYLPWANERRLPQGSQILTAAFVAGNVREQIRKQSSIPEPYAGVQAALRVYEKMRRTDPSFRIAQAERMLAQERSGALRGAIVSAR
jgi:hypothetical protein